MIDSRAHGRHRVAASERPPAVIFIDDDRWESFCQLAAILQKAGVRTVRISVGPVKMRPENLLFSRSELFSVPPSPEQLATILAGENVVDIQPTESLAVTSYAAVDLLPVEQRSDKWVGRVAILDKWRIAEFVRQLGLRSPESLSLEDNTAIEAVSLLSLPIVVKRRIGSSGSTVKVFTSLDDLQNYVTTIESSDDWFYERFIDGESFVCAACVGDQGIDVIATYAILKRIHPRGPSSVVEFRNDEKIENSGRMLIDALRIRGLVCFDFIRDSDGVDWIHDVNPRTFGGFSMCQLAGFDFRSAYLRCLGDSVAVVSSPPALAQSTSYGFPEGRKDLLRSKSSRMAWLASVSWIWRNWRLLGSRYFLFSLIDRVFFAWRSSA